MKPITVFWRNHVPNPSKVLIILEELGLPYQSSWVELENLKKPPFIDVNPNGRVPGTFSNQLIFAFALAAIIDPNNDITLFESGAIVSYLIKTYDKSYALTYPSSPETFYLEQWSYLQASGQGPYFGQASMSANLFELARFNLFHPEPLPSACERYNNEINRVAKVFDSHLANRSWLVGDKCTYADLAFVMWNAQIAYVLKDAKDAWDPAKYPNFTRWHNAMLARDSVKHVLSVLAEQEVKSSGKH